MNTSHEHTIRSVAVYCGSTFGTEPAFREAARATGAELARRGLRLVYGGGNVGLMGEVADATLAHGGQVTGVIPTQLVNREMAHRGIQHLETVDTMAQRKARMEELADAFLVLPGGIGTLEEVTQVLTREVLGDAQGPVGFINPLGYWDPLLGALKAMVDYGFLPGRYVEGLAVDPDPAVVLDRCTHWRNPGAKWEGED